VRWKFNRQRESKNPLFTKSTWQQFVIERFSFFGWLSILFFLVIIYLLFYSPLLQITRVDIRGTQNISPKIIEEKFINWQLQQSRFKVFKQNNLIMFSKKWLNQRLNNDYGLASLKIQKKFPHSLIVTIQEKTPELIWSSQGKYHYLSENGDLAQVVDITPETSPLPIIYDDANTEAKPGQNILATDRITFIKNLTNEIKQINSVEVDSFHLQSNLGTQISVQVKAGYNILFDISKDLAAQLEKLRRTLSDASTLANPPQEYIDVRLGDRVYIK
jgi:cell division septal protein FtsQ